MQSILELHYQRQSQRRGEYQAIVVGLATGDEPEPEHVLSVLDALSRTPAELTADVRRLRQRLDMAARRDSLPALSGRRGDVEAAIAAERERFEALRLEHLQRLRPLQDDLRHVIDRLTDAAGAEGELIATSSEPLKEAIASRRRQPAGKGGGVADLQAAATDPVEGLFWE